MADRTVKDVRPSREDRARRRADHVSDDADPERVREQVDEHGRRGVSQN